VPSAFFDTVVRESLKVPARVRRAVFEGSMEDDASREVGRSEAPTLIVWGDREVFVPRSDQKVLAVTIAGSRLEVYPGAGHTFHREEPESVADDLATVADKVAG
jgi:pimeloyl-ACP methyl ester carboxylesterase